MLVQSQVCVTSYTLLFLSSHATHFEEMDNALFRVLIFSLLNVFEL